MARHRVLRVAKHAPDLALFDNAPAFKHADPIAEGANDLHFVGDQHDSQPQALVNLLQQG
jgi:hypothetical protein